MKNKTAKPEKKAKFNHKDHWKGMPEFTQNNLKPIHQVIVSFQNKEDMLKFSKLVGQEVKATTRSIWYPEVQEQKAQDKRWTDAA